MSNGVVFRKYTIYYKPPHRGFHLITDEILKEIEIKDIETGLLNLFLKHTSASLTINENASYGVKEDMEFISSALVSEEYDYIHDLEGRDDMPAHFKSSMFGVSLNIPISNGKLNLGLWQGIYLNEHRNHPTRREIAATVFGV
ncbi:MAG: YjbQ family protein [Epsilonproteobacteria bacterium]|nr:YjbQ family protein [Campylobacterota bacterium]